MSSACSNPPPAHHWAPQSCRLGVLPPPEHAAVLGALLLDMLCWCGVVVLLVMVMMVLLKMVVAVVAMVLL